jgi:uncharacterized protein (DUF1697 family)
MCCKKESICRARIPVYLWINDTRKKNIYQCALRPFRLYPGKALAHIVTACSDEYLESTRLFKVLANEDSRLKTSILHKKQGRLQFVRVREKKEETEVASETSWYETVFSRVSLATDHWMYMYMELKLNYDDMNRLYPANTRDTDIQRRKMSSWISFQQLCKRCQNKKYTINEQRIKLLETLKYWSWKTIDKWTLMFTELKEKYDDIDVPYPPETDKDVQRKRIGRWICNQRQAKRGGNKGIMNEKRIKSLESLKHWTWLVDKWTPIFTELKEKYDDFDIPYPANPKDADPTRKKIAHWIYNQRQIKKGNSKNKHAMDEHRIKLLESLRKWKW